MYFIGLDLSINNTGVVVIDRKKNIIDYLFFRNTLYKQTNKITVSERFHENDHVNLSMKIIFVARKILELVEKYENAFVGIEGYSYHSKSNSITKLAELGGCIKMELLRRGFRYDVFTPCTVKKCVTGNGFAKKFEVMDECIAHIKKIPWIDEGDKVFDLYDALSIALFARVFYFMGNKAFKQDKIVWKKIF